MKLLQQNSVDNTLGALFDFAYFFNFSNMLFGGGGDQNDIFHQLVSIFFKIHVHEYIFY